MTPDDIDLNDYETAQAFANGGLLDAIGYESDLPDWRDMDELDGLPIYH